MEVVRESAQWIQDGTIVTSSEHELINDFDLDYIELYVQDLDAHLEIWGGRYGFAQLGAGGSDQDGFRSVVLGRGAMKLVLTEATRLDHPAASYVLVHGDGVANIAMRTADVRAAFSRIVGNGGRALAEPHEHDDPHVELSATVGGFGDLVHTLVQRSASSAGLPAGFRRFSPPQETVKDSDHSFEVLAADHFAVCVNVDELDHTVAFYEEAFGFTETFQERIVVGSQAMLSKVVQSKSRTVTFTIIQPDPTADPGQIDEFLKNHNGAGVQHVALAVDDIVKAVQGFARNNVQFLTTPDAYYALLRDRISAPKHSIDGLHALNILVDQDHFGQLFQIFTRSTHERRTLFFEVIERCGAETFGSSNIKALYEAVEMERAMQSRA